MLASHEVDPSRLRLEVTEGALLENPDQVQLCLGQLRADEPQFFPLGVEFLFVFGEFALGEGRGTVR